MNNLILQIVSGSSIAAFVFIMSLWVLKKTFGELIKGTLQKEFVNHSEQIRKDTETALNNQKHSLTIELAKISSDLAVAAETYKLAAHHRYKIIEVTWLLFKNLQFDLDESYADDDPLPKTSFTQNIHKAFMNLYNDRVYFSKETYSQLEKLYNSHFQYTELAIMNKTFPAFEQMQGILNELLDILRKEIGTNL